MKGNNMRKIEKLMTNWSFVDKDKNKVVLDLPHTWNNIDGQDGGNDYYRGVFTYEKKVNCPSYDKEKEAVYLVFEGVNSSAKIIFNNNHFSIVTIIHLPVALNKCKIISIKLIIKNSAKIVKYFKRFGFFFKIFFYSFNQILLKILTI